MICLPSFILAIYISLFWALFCWLASKITCNYSWVDRLWSLLPTFYCYFFISYEFFCNDKIFNIRQVVIALLCTLWTIRLTYNYYRKGGYKRGSEDYRWEYVKKYINNAIFFEILNIFFIAIIQNFLLLYIAIPISISNFRNYLNRTDYLLISTFLLCLGLETLADQQQWIFQTKKHQLLKENKTELLKGDYKRGFLTRGLFSYSRHPNFLGEMCLWWVVYLFSVDFNENVKNWGNWTIFGALGLTLLFQCSTTLTEIISKGKYPVYGEYQKEVSRIMLWFSRKKQE